MIVEQLKKIVKKMSAVRVQHEALVATDFKICDEKAGLMQMCFSVFAQWPVAVAILILFLNPFRYQMSVQSLLGFDGRIMVWTYSENFLLGYIIFAVLASLIKIELLWLTVIAFLISNGEVHVLVAVGAATGVFFASARRNLNLISALDGRIKGTWIFYTALQMVLVFAAAAINYVIYMNLKNFGYFNATMYVNRYEFFSLAILIHYIVQFMGASLWGHFYARRKVDPSDWKVSYSTGLVLSRLNLSSAFQNELKQLVQEKMNPNSQQEPTKGIPERLLKLAQTEQENLKQAQEFLNS
jgi:hypothetical protein